jgi:ABC-type Fe3+-hydroxamate transport system substrate-binding protein
VFDLYHRFSYRGSLSPVLRSGHGLALELALTLVAVLAMFAAFAVPTPSRSAGAAVPVYATLGPEAPAILRVLVGDSRIVALQPGGLAEALKDRTLAALVLPEDWADDADLHAARAAGLTIVRLRRQISVANILANIRQLADLTGTVQAGARWIDDIQRGLDRIRLAVRGDPPVRVLMLSPEGYTQGQGALITELIDIAGGVNAAAEAGIAEARQVDDAQIRALRPDVVLLTGWTPDAAAEFAANPLYRGVPAFDQARVYRIAAPGKDPARLVADVQALAEWLHGVEV